MNLSKTSFVNYLKTLKLFKGSGRVSDRVFASFCRQVTSLLGSGLPISQSLQIMAHNKEFDQTFRDSIESALSKIENGASLAESFSSLHSFPYLFIRLVLIGEKSGHLSYVFSESEKIYQEKADRREKILSMLLYPFIVLCLCFLIMLFLSTYALPVFEESLSQSGMSTPLFTQVVLGFYRLFPIILVLGTILTHYWLRLIKKRSESDAKYAIQISKRKFSFPIIGKLLFFEQHRLISLMLSILSHTGMSLPDAVEIVGQTQNDAFVHFTLREIQEKLFSGLKFSETLSSEFFDPIWTSLVQTAEMTGDFERSFHILTQWYQGLLSSRIEKISKLIEPVMTGVLGLFVGITAAALILPLYQSYEGMASLL